MTCDDWETPFEEFRFALQNLSTENILWDPFYCSGRSGVYLEDLGFDIIEGIVCEKDCKEAPQELCLCMKEPKPANADIIVTNPPFSILDKAVPWLLSHDLPVFMLLPQKFVQSEMFEKMAKHSEVSHCDPRFIGFIKEGVKYPKAEFACVWVECWPIC